tara:strand:- start:270 stop:2162 length:1893 start_codon:yes stop_codon:yes gene_type:complete
MLQTDFPTPASIRDLPVYLNQRYRRLVFVTRDRHLERIDARDADTLIVSANWLLWQEALARGEHCVHTHLGLVDWDTEDLDQNLWLKAYDWVYDNGADQTLFRDISLGRKFAKEISFVIADVARLDRIFRQLIERFGPQEIEYLDCKTDTGYLGQAYRVSLIRHICEDCNVAFIDGSDAGEANIREMPINRFAGLMQEVPSTRDRIRTMVRSGFGFLANSASRVLRRVGERRNIVLMLSTHLNTTPLLQSYDGKHVRPMLLADWFPNKSDLRSVLSALRKGVLLVHTGPQKLTAAERNRLDEIRAYFEKCWKTKTSAQEKVLRDYVLDNVLLPGRLAERAKEVKWAEALLETHRPDEVFSDALTNPMVKTVLEVATLRGLRTNSTLHGQFIQPTKIEIFGCDPRVPPVVTRCLTWGRVHEKWLDSIGAKCEQIRTGNLISGKYRKMALPAQAPGAKPKRALVLQYAVPYNNFAALTSNEYEYYVRIVRELKALGFEEICVKIHPKVPKIEYYNRIAAFFGLSCTVVEQGAFETFVKWADVVIGPVHSGAMLEVLASGKPYFPAMLKPDSADPAYFPDSTIYRETDDIIDALKRGDVPENPWKILNHFTSIDEIPDAAAQTWKNFTLASDG